MDTQNQTLQPTTSRVRFLVFVLAGVTAGALLAVAAITAISYQPPFDPNVPSIALAPMNAALTRALPSGPQALHLHWALYGRNGHVVDSLNMSGYIDVTPGDSSACSFSLSGVQVGATPAAGTTRWWMIKASGRDVVVRSRLPKSVTSVLGPSAPKQEKYVLAQETAAPLAITPFVSGGDLSARGTWCGISELPRWAHFGKSLPSAPGTSATALSYDLRAVTLLYRIGLESFDRAWASGYATSNYTRRAAYAALVPSAMPPLSDVLTRMPGELVVGPGREVVFRSLPGQSSRWSFEFTPTRAQRVPVLSGSSYLQAVIAASRRSGSLNLPG